MASHQTIYNFNILIHLLRQRNGSVFSLLEYFYVFILNNILPLLAKEIRRTNFSDEFLLMEKFHLWFNKVGKFGCSANYFCNADKIVTNIIGLIYCNALIMFRFQLGQQPQLSTINRYIVWSWLIQTPIILTNGISHKNTNLITINKQL